jgi:YegS/Rv2252/BmrU family lipid kinase
VTTERTARAAVAIVSGSSRNGPRLASALKSAFAGRAPFRIRLIRSSDEAIEAAREAALRADTVIAVGGDGTVSDVATGILGTGAILGIVPSGSTNIIARALRIPARPTAAIEMLASAHDVRAIDAGLCGDRCFLHMAGAGFDAALFRATKQALKRHLGWMAYLPAAIEALRTAPSEVIITVDGASVEERSPLVLVANGGAVVVPSLEIYPDISVDDGWFDILVFSTVTWPQIITALGLTGLRSLHRSPHVRRIRGKEVRIEAAPSLPIQLDGDVRGQTPVTFALLPLAMNVAVPFAPRNPRRMTASFATQGTGEQDQA